MVNTAWAYNRYDWNEHIFINGLAHIWSDHFFSHTFTFRKNYNSFVAWIISAFSYFGSYAYLILFGIFVSLIDKIGNALIFNISYPDSFDGYLKAFLVSSTWPATSLLALLFCVAALVTLSGQRRIFVSLWIILSIGLALNPITAQVLLVVFRGIYFRLFYIIFHPLFAGMVAASASFLIEKRYGVRWQSVSFVVIALIAIAPTILSSSSIFINPRYEFGNWAPTDDYPPAKKIVNITPEGVMLAPYPISGTIRMISSNYPQMEARDDIVSFYLGLQGREADAKIRLQANNFLQGQMQDFQAFANLISHYPEIRSVVFSSDGLANMDSKSIDLFLTSNGFLHGQNVGKYIVYWR